ncbi:DUF226 domain-containing protein (plasmid) [Borrelia coriaceae]|uniref:Putative cytosolic protein n=1 Tax=Borrelia coriaceae ATCC 43381 TaxID=1408429 RepID=W5SXD2_9SPIR|nr:DUF226 domain-containing protein [Borrelia coriaceae]AHH11537.1 Putative cytosolic protein [Borrelia coriaceae ATCC 43381]UPA17163.1 DUF226 domain-containing protein [Borrelia coriaceae]
MENILMRLKTKKSEIKEIKKERIFAKIEEDNARKIYHTKIMNDLYVFGINKNQTHKFFVSFRGLFNRAKINEFNLFSIKGNDKFLGIYYGYRKPIQRIITKYEENGIMKSSTFSKVYYIEFRFKKGSVYCYIKGISRLIRKGKTQTQYSQFLLGLIIKLEKEVYEFYNKKLPDGGIITKWIEKNQK